MIRCECIPNSKLPHHIETDTIRKRPFLIAMPGEKLNRGAETVRINPFNLQLLAARDRSQEISGGCMTMANQQQRRSLVQNVVGGDKAPPFSCHLGLNTNRSSMMVIAGIPQRQKARRIDEHVSGCHKESCLYLRAEFYLSGCAQLASRSSETDHSSHQTLWLVRSAQDALPGVRAGRAPAARPVRLAAGCFPHPCGTPIT